VITTRPADAETLGLQGLDWLLGMARDTGTGLAWTSTPSDDELNPTLYSGTAGVVLALLEGQRHFDDEVRVGTPARFHHLSHGTLGIAYALAAVGRAAGRRDLTELAVAGAADVVARNEAGPAGFLVPHSDPQHKPELVERYSYGWCHGPAGDAQAFRLLSAVLHDPAWSACADQCWYTVTHSGLPQRLRPGFWDNSGRCCGTAGVLALACDRQVEHGDGLDFADVLVADLAARATRDAEGARWSNVEHRVTPGTLEPRIGWAMGTAGIVRELLRFARAGTGRDPAYAVALPDHLAADPSLRNGFKENSGGRQAA
jgi:hypothetical protein